MIFSRRRRAHISRADVSHADARESAFAVEIYLYNTADPIIIPLRAPDPAAAESYVEQLKFEVIEAQRHGHRLVRLTRQDPLYDAMTMEPSTIKRVNLVATDWRAAAEDENPASGRQSGGLVA